ncbi:O-antigen polymerase [Longimicrobium sp.]|uniref:O-antigen polymerase n=1 Tax=Longimicrobium sp. TaxID=2029185 RepID=UPI002CB06AD5|nr:O-antigen polymerase [Longimicrobium sp.]HSU17096.1 O-antigen polymerase [Longimicrobium sp.]
MAELRTVPGALLGGAPAGRWMPSGGGVPDEVARELNPFVPIRPAYRLALLTAGAAYVALAGSIALFTGAPGAEWIIPGLAFLVACRLMVLYLPLRATGWFHPLVLGALLSARPLLQEFPSYAWGLSRHAALPQVAGEELGRLLGWKLALSGLGVLSLYAGFFFGPRLPLPRVRFPARASVAPRALAAVGVAAGAFWLYVSQRGGIAGHLLSWSGGRAEALSGSFYWVVLVSTGGLACLLWFANDRAALRRPLFLAAAAVSLAIDFLAAGSRGAVLGVLIAGFLLWALRERRISWVRFGGLCMAAVVTVGLLGEFRRGLWRGHLDYTVLTEFSLSEVVHESALPELVSRRTVEEGTLPILARVPTEVDHIYGSSYLAVLTLPVPRGMWPAKPGMVGGRIGRTFFGVRSGVPATAVGEAYWNFHIPGIILVFALFGVFLKWMASLLAAHGRSPTLMLFYVLVMWLAPEPTSDAVVQVVFMAVPFVVLAAAFGLLRTGRAHPLSPAEAP